MSISKDLLGAKMGLRKTKPLKTAEERDIEKSKELVLETINEMAMKWQNNYF